jgi:hypothetical protein
LTCWVFYLDNVRSCAGAEYQQVKSLMPVHLDYMTPDGKHKFNERGFVGVSVILAVAHLR